MTHEEYLDMNDKVREYVKLNTKKSDLLSLKANMNIGGHVSIIGKDRHVKNIEDLDNELHENIKEVINFEIGKIVERIVMEMDSI